MGRNNKSYYKDLKQQITDRYTGMLAIGESKKEAILKGTDKDKIFSYSTYHSYKKHAFYFADYLKQTHPECTTLSKADKYVKEWLEKRSEQVNSKGEKLSAWTIQLEAKAMGKLFGIEPGDKNYFEAPKRERQDIKRSRGDTERDRHFSEKNNDEFVKFCKGTGCRRNIMEKLQGKDLISREEMEKKVEDYDKKADITDKERKDRDNLKDALKQFPDQTDFLHHRTDKGGRDRYAPIIGPDKEKIIERMKETAPDDKVWKHVPGNADIHSYRGEYATQIYKGYARQIKDIPHVITEKDRKVQKEVYTCRKDEKGKKLDKVAMEKASKALGHNRLEIVANNYLRGI